MVGTSSPQVPSDFKVAIIGSGFAGLCMAIQLRKAGIDDFVILEKDAALGGTWRDNTYPGSGCDIPSFLYSYSFEMKKDWSRRFVDQPEILEYMNHCADKYGVRPHIRFNTEVASARFDENAGRWHVATTDGAALTARVLVSGTGQRNRPHIPGFDGLEDFQGVVFHSARWRHDHDLSGRRVAVIGNGASALQFIPIITPKTRRMTLFQRSANWVLPKPDRPYNALELWLFRNVPGWARLYRWYIYWSLEARFPLFASINFFSRWYSGLMARSMRRKVKDPALQAALLPDYPIGCKRVLLSETYYDALIRDNAEVVTSPIERILPGGVRTADGRVFEADTIIFGTGFEATGFLMPMEVRGLGGRSINDAWRDGAEAYLGVAVAGFPNFYMLYGPNTNLGHNSIIFMIEAQVNYVMQCLRGIESKNLRALDVRKPAMDDYNQEIQSALARSSWAGGCSSWYKNASGRITNNWAYGTFAYWRRLRNVDWSAFDEKTG